MDIEKFRKIIDEREHISVESHDEWDYGIQQCWEKEVAILKAGEVQNAIRVLNLSHLLYAFLKIIRAR